MTRILASTGAALITALAAFPAAAEPQSYTIDPAHSELVASWSHGGFSTTRLVIFDIQGDIMYDQEDPANSSVSIQMPVMSVIVTPEFTEHLMSNDFFGAEEGDMITFESTGIEVTGENTADITGDLTVNGVTNEVVLETTLANEGQGPRGNPISGFEATTTLTRSNFDMGMFTPFVSDEVAVVISLEASPAES